MQRPAVGYVPEMIAASAVAVSALYWTVPTLLALAGLVTFLLLRGQLARVAAVLSLLGVLACSWNGVKIANITAGDVFFVTAVPFLLIHAATAKRKPGDLRVPLWMLVGAAGIALAAVIVAVFPPPVGYFDIRFSAQGGATSLLNEVSNSVSLIRFEAALLIAPLVVAWSSRLGLVKARVFGDVWAIGVVASCFVSITDRLGLTAISPRLGTSVALYTGRESGLTVTPNHLAVSTSLVVPIVLTWFVRSRRSRLCAVPASAVLLGGLYNAGSAGASVAAIVAVALSFALIPELRRYALRVAALLVLGAVLVVGPAEALGADLLAASRIQRTTTTGGLQSDLQRHILATQAQQDFKTRPVQGVGLSQIGSGHRNYLQLLAATGLIGAVSYYLYILGALRVAFRRRTGLLDPLLVAASGVSLAAFVIEGLVENQLIDRYLYVSVGLILAASRTVTSAGPQPAAASDGAFPQNAKARSLAGSR